MEIIRRWVPLLVVVACTLGIQIYVARWLVSLATIATSARRRSLVWGGFAATAAWMAAAVPFLASPESSAFPPTTVAWLMASSLFWTALVLTAGSWVCLHRRAQVDLSRRRFLQTAATGAAMLPLGTTAFGIVQARGPARLAEVDVKIEGLARDLNGLRIAQLTDIHYGPFLGARDLERAVAMANEARPHLTVVTGDLITRRGDDLEGCLRILAGLRADAGVLGCHGNHEIYARVVEQATAGAARRGIRILRADRAGLRFGEARLNVAGYDYQRINSHYLPGAEKLVEDGAVNLLLSHNPAVFPQAAKAGFDLVLAGHTHGGQINVEILSENVSVARIFTPYVKGMYESGGARMYVSCGLGTVAVPVRLGAPPEVTIVRLCAV
jgi:hypothetical protein